MIVAKPLRRQHYDRHYPPDDRNVAEQGSRPRTDPVSVVGILRRRLHARRLLPRLLRPARRTKCIGGPDVLSALAAVRHIAISIINYVTLSPRVPAILHPCNASRTISRAEGASFPHHLPPTSHHRGGTPPVHASIPQMLLRSVILILLFAAAAFSRPLQVFFIDVEGGQATLVIAPSGQSLLIDTGWRGFDGRDA